MSKWSDNAMRTLLFLRAQCLKALIEVLLKFQMSVRKQYVNLVETSVNGPFFAQLPLAISPFLLQLLLLFCLSLLRRCAKQNTRQIKELCCGRGVSRGTAAGGSASFHLDSGSPGFVLSVPARCAPRVKLFATD